jgi:hypothetical protein
MVAIGLRDIVPSIDMFPVNKLFCKFDISGDSKHPIYTGTHAVFGGSCNVFEVITIEVDVPVDLEYSPILTVYVYDNMMGVFGERLVGVANIPLIEYCRKVVEKVDIVSKILKDNVKGKLAIPAEESKTPVDVVPAGSKFKMASILKDKKF